MRLISGSAVVSRLCAELKYTRSHVAKILRENQSVLRARRVKGRWKIPAAEVKRLRSLVCSSSGPRYKLGEKGANRT